MSTDIEAWLEAGRRKVAASKVSIVEVTVNGDEVIINDIHHSNIDFPCIEIRSESPCG